MDEAYEGVYYILSKKFKDMMPRVLLHVNQLFLGDLEACLPAAYAIELFNNSAIVLDDVTDYYSPYSDKITLFKKLDPSAAIIAGDQLMILSYKYLTMVNPIYIKHVLQI